MAVLKLGMVISFFWGYCHSLDPLILPGHSPELPPILLADSNGFLQMLPHGVLLWMGRISGIEGYKNVIHQTTRVITMLPQLRNERHAMAGEAKIITCHGVSPRL